MPVKIALFPSKKGPTLKKGEKKLAPIGVYYFKIILL